MIAHSPADVALSRQLASIYRSRGYNVLPSRADDKRPHIHFKDYWDRPLPEGTVERFPTANLQIMTGRRWGLLVIDLDGPEGIEQFGRWQSSPVRTWVTHSGGSGRHLWFTVPTEGPPIPSGRLWGIWDATARDGRGEWSKHRAIEVLGDRKLVMAPPSIHPKTGRKYRFIGKACSPLGMARPAPCPGWILGLPILSAPKPPAPAARPIDPAPEAGDGLDWRLVMAAIPDKAAVAVGWGLRLAQGRPNKDGWIPCHVVDREDVNPSAGFSAESGSYWDHERGIVRFFDLAVLLGRHRTWGEACDATGRAFGVKPSG